MRSAISMVPLGRPATGKRSSARSTTSWTMSDRTTAFPNRSWRSGRPMSSASAAPYLAKGAGLYSALRANGFRYDTSGVGHADAWPEKVDGLWRFNLAMLRIQGLGRGTLSMDYNFFVAQSRAADDPRRYEAAREQMLQTYLHYFKTNYAGNRAPLHIGHHFMNYQGGAYNEALKSFARAVCGLPEVRCVTYAKLADFMDQQSAETLAAYRKGDFARAATPTLNVAAVSR